MVVYTARAVLQDKGHDVSVACILLVQIHEGRRCTDDPLLGHNDLDLVGDFAAAAGSSRRSKTPATLPPRC
jgi:hypothetical protein